MYMLFHSSYKKGASNSGSRTVILLVLLLLVFRRHDSFNTTTFILSSVCTHTCGLVQTGYILHTQIGGCMEQEMVPSILIANHQPSLSHSKICKSQSMKHLYIVKAPPYHRLFYPDRALHSNLTAASSVLTSVGWTPRSFCQC